MKIKVLTFIALFSAVIAIYAKWPEKNPAQARTYQPVKPSQECSQEIGSLLKTIQAQCAKKRYQWLENHAFAVPQELRRQEKESTGTDSVETSLDILKKNADRLDWHSYEIIAYSNAPFTFDVKIAGSDRQNLITLHLRRFPKNRTYGLVNIEEEMPGD